jgi:hypothetical protein
VITDNNLHHFEAFEKCGVQEEAKKPCLSVTQRSLEEGAEPA